MKDLIVLKLGGSIITKKSEGKLEVNERNLSRLSGEVASALNEGGFKLIVVHGAGPFGHVLADKYQLAEGLKGPEQLEGVCLTHQSMEKLNCMVVSALTKAGVKAIALQPSAGGILEDKKLVAFPLEAVQGMIDAGLVPVGYGDVLVDTKTGINILSGDHLVPYLARELKASRVVIATDVDGIYDGDPKEGGAMKVDVISRSVLDEIHLGGSRSTDVTGGMRGKVLELLELSDHGIRSRVVGGLVKDNLKNALLGAESIGTLIE